MGMTLTARRIPLWILVLLGLYVGLWALLFPASFYESFPGPLGAWVAADGPYNEHLVRDVGAFNLGLAVASAAASRYRERGPGLVVAMAWIVYSVPHLGYHLHHLAGLPVVDAVAQVIALSVTAVLAVPLLLPVRESPSADPTGVRGAFVAGTR
ncbi:hypothetical protein SAMN05660662_1418 [Blastococcus aurantiacus]|uniref:Uncharacterized protein n=1 Tax=Blastococcus aurantiacus TaxID=1550231 RepID=A0A1G7JBW3_9ACTN|nr:hypothetical protein [Blastococcus aurantiacus]SDF22411.1 hypothetical protein SAMN05660662_1418 [Blastococcus aurantiacus]